MNNKKKLLALAIVLALAVTGLAGCGVAISDGSSGSGGGNSYNLQYQCAWGSGAGPYTYAAELSEAIVSVTGGRVTMDCLATNSVVSTADMLEAVSTGVIDCAHTCSTNFSDDSLGILSSSPAGMSFDEYMGWYLSGEGQQILDEVMAEIAPNVVAFPCGVVDSEILYHSTTPIQTISDIKGLKIRGVSDWAEIETRLGASVVTMDGGDCYEALSRGTIDACEYSSPATNYSAGFHEVAPYMTVPGIHQSSAVYLFLINRDTWNSLDEQVQNAIKVSCTAMMAQNYAEDHVANADAWAKYEELAEQGKLTIYRLPDEDIALINEVADEYYAEKCESNELFAKIYNSQKAYIENVSAWTKAASADIAAG